jgi:glutamate-5-semialdehyde dehydrogenase
MKPVLPQLIKTHKASTSLQASSDNQLKKMLRSLADELVANTKQLLKANAADLSRQAADNPKNDRLMLNEQRIKNIAASIKKVATLPDPTGKVIEERTLPNGLQLQKTAVLKEKWWNNFLLQPNTLMF